MDDDGVAGDHEACTRTPEAGPSFHIDERRMVCTDSRRVGNGAVVPNEPSPLYEAIEAGPSFHVDERVLCTDSRRTRYDAIAPNEPCPLYEAIIRRANLKYVDPTSGKISGLHDSHDGGGIKQWCHLVHWQGWNARYDQWKTEEEVFHDTPENRPRVEAHRASPKLKDEGKKKKKKRRKEAEEGGAESSFRQNLQLVTKACALPFTLQTLLVDNRDKITRKVYPPSSLHGDGSSVASTMLHALPKKRNIVEVLGAYVRVKKREDLEEFARRREEAAAPPTPPKSVAGEGDTDIYSNPKSTTATIHEHSRDDAAPVSCSSEITKKILKQKKKKRKRFALYILALLDISLPLFLLYGEEREQFATVMGGGGAQNSPAPDKENDTNNSGQEQDTTRPRPSEVYGAEHLLRLFVKLPSILSHFEPQEEVPAHGVAGTEGYDTYLLASQRQSQEFAEHLKELVVFLQRNLECFKGKYHPVEHDLSNVQQDFEL